ncbi:MAG: hypothetical protein ACJAYV_002018, partial [Oleispira sp.]
MTDHNDVASIDLSATDPKSTDFNTIDLNVGKSL